MIDIKNIYRSTRDFISSVYDTKEKDKVADLAAKNNNPAHHKKQITNLLIVLLVPAILAVFMLIYVNKKMLVSDKNKEVGASENVKVELPINAFDPEIHWRNYYEDERKKDKEEFKERLAKLEEQQDLMISKTTLLLEKELSDTKARLLLASAELADASSELKSSRVVESNNKTQSNFIAPHLGVNELSTGIEFDMPKSSANYIPEGTYFTGHLLGGIMVSTALSAPDENSTPVTIRLEHRGNLAHTNPLVVSKCRIMGSAYGDLSSERAIVRLEKMICEVDGNYVTSHIAGQLFGPDGLNGVKGDVVDISEKHIKSAALGGVLSGFANSAKGQDGLSITGLGMLSTEKKGFKDMAKDGILQGAGNAGEKIADYYLRQAERMSPVLTIPGGVRVNAQITKGFFFGEVGMHDKIGNMRVK